MKLFKRLISENGKKGFTLAEMIIVIALMAIVMSFAVPSIARYGRRIELMELDDSARAIFMSVQDKMVVMKQSGVTLELEGSKEMPTIPAEFLPAEDGEAEPDAADSEDEIPVEVVYPKMSYIHSSELKKLDGVGFVNQGSIEGDISTQNFIIEYDSSSGKVYGVFYSEEHKLDDYADWNDTGVYPLSSLNNTKLNARSFEERFEATELIGYYGGGVITALNKDLDTAAMTLIDSSSEKLAIVIKPPRDETTKEYKKGKFYFEVTLLGPIPDYNGNKPPYDINEDSCAKCAIPIVPYKSPRDGGDNSDNYYIYNTDELNGVQSTVVFDSVAPGCGSDAGMWNLPADKSMTGKVLERDFRSWVFVKDPKWRKNEQYPTGKVLFDYYQIDSAENIYECRFEGADGTPYSPYEHSFASANDWAWGAKFPVIGDHVEALKYYYLIDPGADIKVIINIYDEKGAEVDSATFVFNSYFDKLKGTEAQITAGRHLQNIANFANRDLVVSGSLMKDIDFSKNDGTYNTWNSSCTNAGSEKYPWLYNFKPIDSAALTSRWKGIDCNGHWIKYIRIDTLNDPRYNGTWKTKYGLKKITDTGFITDFKSSSSNSGLKFFCPVVIGGGENTGVYLGGTASSFGGSKIEDMVFVNPYVSGPGNVGALAGKLYNSAGTNNIKVYCEEVTDYFNNIDLNFTYDADKGKYVGRKYVYSKSVFDEDGRETRYYVPEGTSDLKWGDPGNDPYSKFGIFGTGSDSYAGGVCGVLGGQNRRSDLSAVNAAVHVESNGYAGGICGYAMCNSSSDWVVGGHTYNGSFAYNGDYLYNIDGKKGAGGLVAVLEGTAPKGFSYASCSVARYGNAGDNAGSKVKYDTFIPKANAAQSRCSATGWLIGKNKAEALSTRVQTKSAVIVEKAGDRYPGVESLKKAKTQGRISFKNISTFSYDPTYLNKSKKPYVSVSYPYYFGDSEGTAIHYGDWP